jgi:hypothetical protein
MGEGQSRKKEIEERMMVKTPVKSEKDSRQAPRSFKVDGEYGENRLPDERTVTALKLFAR